MFSYKVSISEGLRNSGEESNLHFTEAFNV